jgi:hypothetical protein
LIYCMFLSWNHRDSREDAVERKTSGSLDIGSVCERLGCG